MTGPRDKPPPTKSEEDFSDLTAELNDEPTGKFTAVSPELADAVRKPPETLPAPPDPELVARAAAEAPPEGSGTAGPRRSPSRDDIRKRTSSYGAMMTPTRPRSDAAIYAASTARDKWRETAAIDDLFAEPRTRPPAAGSGAPAAPPGPRSGAAAARGPAEGAGEGDDDDAFGKRPTREAPPSNPAMAAARQPAPRPARVPSVDPLAEFAFGFEPDANAAAAAAAAAASRAENIGGDEPTPARGLPPVTPHAAGVVDPDLSWDDAPGAGEPARGAGAFAAPVLPAASDDEGDAWSLVNNASQQPVAMVPPDPRRELSERFALGDFSGALVIAEALIAEGRADPQVDKLARDCRAQLEQMYTARLGDMTQVPSVAVPRSELKWLSLDHRAGFLLSLVDGASSIEEIIDVSGMPPLEVLRTLYDLMGQHVIEFHAGNTRRR